jgi:hypothetical protein
MPPRVVRVEIDQRDALPLAERWIAAIDRDRDRLADLRGQQVVVSVAERAMAVLVSLVERLLPRD